MKSVRSFLSIALLALFVLPVNAATAPFLAAKSYPVGGLPVAAVAADFNSDGKMDVVVANTFTTTVSVLLGLGDGSFKPQVTYGVVQHPNSVAAGDFNGDGKLDLAVGLLQGLAILFGNGDGTFQAAMVTTNQGVGFLCTADLNHDGKLDLIYLASGGVTVQLGNGDGTFQSPTSSSVLGAG